jgi:hypothetical protein
MRLKRKCEDDLTPDQEVCLMSGVDFGEPFASPSEHEAAWWRHREYLLQKCEPFRRPAAYWFYETSAKPHPNCPLNGNETERSALLRLNLPLTAREEKILREEGIL